jgi:uncharacterized protein YdhG (YjbR/CyaY superfamily)
MEKTIQNFYLFENEPVSSCLLALKAIIQAHDQNLEASMKYGMPFFSYGGNMFCYLWVDKKTQFPYIGMVEGYKIDHPLLIADKRSRIKIIDFNPNEDLPIDTINEILKLGIDLYKTGEIKLKKVKK